MQATAELGFASIGAGGGTGYFSTVYVPTEQPKPQFVVHKLLLDSRDAVSFANTSSAFACRFDLTACPHGEYTNVISAELKGAAVPKANAENYCLVDIPQLSDDQLDATNSNTHNTFAALFFDSSALADGCVKPLRGADFYSKVVRYRSAINRLDTLDVSIRLWDGSVLSPGSAGGANSFQLLLEMVCLNNRRF